MSSAPLREAAESSKAWPFEEARKLIERLKRFEGKEVIFEDRLRPFGSTAPRHVRRGRPYEHGSTRLSRPDRRQL